MKFRKWHIPFTMCKSWDAVMNNVDSIKGAWRKTGLNGPGECKRETALARLPSALAPEVSSTPLVKAVNSPTSLFAGTMPSWTVGVTSLDDAVQQALLVFMERITSPSMWVDPDVTTQGEAWIEMLRLVLSFGWPVYGGVLRDLFGDYLNDIADIDVECPTKDDLDTYVETLTRSASELEWHYAFEVEKGDKVREVYYSWKPLDHYSSEPMPGDEGLVCVQMVVRSDFTNKHPDFSVCQLTGQRRDLRRCI